MARITKGSHKIGLVYLVYVVLIFLGMLDGLLEGAWPTLRVDYSIPIDSPGMFLFAANTGYVTSSFLSGASVGFSSAPIFPALMSGTSQRVGVHCPANTIGMQMAAPSLGAALVPSLMDGPGAPVFFEGSPPLFGGSDLGIVWSLLILQEMTRQVHQEKAS